MTRNRRMHFMITFVVVLFLSCCRIDNTPNFSYHLPASMNAHISYDADSNAVCDVNRSCSQVEQQEYLGVSQSVRVSHSLSRRLSGGADNSRRNKTVCCAVLWMVKLSIFTGIIFLLAARNNRFSTPFLCLLHYIHSKDGKKESNFI